MVFKTETGKIIIPTFEQLVYLKECRLAYIKEYFDDGENLDLEEVDDSEMNIEFVTDGWVPGNKFTVIIGLPDYPNEAGNEFDPTSWEFEYTPNIELEEEGYLAYNNFELDAIAIFNGVPYHSDNRAENVKPPLESPIEDTTLPQLVPGDLISVRHMKSKAQPSVEPNNVSQPIPHEDPEAGFHHKYGEA